MFSVYTERSIWLFHYVIRDIIATTAVYQWKHFVDPRSGGGGGQYAKLSEDVGCNYTGSQTTVRTQNLCSADLADDWEFPAIFFEQNILRVQLNSGHMFNNNIKTDCSWVIVKHDRVIGVSLVFQLVQYLYIMLNGVWCDGTTGTYCFAQLSVLPTLGRKNEHFIKFWFEFFETHVRIVEYCIV